MEGRKGKENEIKQKIKEKHKEFISQICFSRELDSMFKKHTPQTIY
jgi:hypothetical protein